MVYNDYDSIFNKLLEIANESAIHMKNIHVLQTEIYKFLNFKIFFKKGLPIVLKKPKIFNHQ